MIRSVSAQVILLRDEPRVPQHRKPHMQDICAGSQNFNKEVVVVQEMTIHFFPYRINIAKVSRLAFGQQNDTISQQLTSSMS